MRAETGSMRFGDDWTGVFIRGDEAAYLHGLVQRLRGDDDVHIAYQHDLQRLINALEGYMDMTPTNQLRSIEECIDED